MTTPQYLPPPKLRNIRPIGKCIYCGCSDKLTREHVVPRGMGEDVTLPKGSCTTCAEVTKKIETACMRATLIHVRVKYGLHKHPKERPDSFPVVFTDWSGNETIRQIPAEDFPTLWAMPIYEYPGILLNKKQEDARFGILHAHKDEASFQKLLRLPGVKSVTVRSWGVDTWSFARWIAKIGYCYAVACLGLEKVKASPLVDMIINGSKYPNYLIGGLNKLNLLISEDFTLEPKNNELFKVYLQEIKAFHGKSYIAVYVRLLPMLQGATYIAVINENT